MGTTRCLFDLLWVQLKKFASLVSWQTWLENRQSWIIKIGAEFIIQVSLVLSERTLHEGQTHLFCDDNVSGFRNWFIEAWMSINTCRNKIPRVSSDSDEQKQVLQETMIFCVLEINWLAARDTPFSSSKTTCNISATFSWVLKSKGTPLKLNSLRFKTHKKLDRSTGLFKFFFYGHSETDSSSHRWRSVWFRRDSVPEGEYNT